MTEGNQSKPKKLALKFGFDDDAEREPGARRNLKRQSFKLGLD
jgi:hypothetical protein